MKHIVCGTDRPNSNSLKVCQWLKNEYSNLGEETEVLELEKMSLGDLPGAGYGLKEGAHIDWVTKVNQSEGLVIVIPEYNGSYPGILKLFIDHWSYPESFESRPVAFVGLGGRFGGLRPVEHMQQVFGYRNAFIFPERVFISNVWNVLQGDEIKDEMINSLLKKQCSGFSAFIRALKSEKLDALSKPQPKS